MRVVITLVVLTALLQACETVQVPGVTSDSRSEPAPTTYYEPRQGISDSERFVLILKMLEAGEAGSARAELLVYLQSQPRNKVAQDMLRQIDEPASTYFPSAYREIRLRSGQSLSLVAEQYLGGYHKFFALAKFNGISEPSRLTTGKIVRVPLTSEARTAFAAEEATAKSQTEAPEEEAIEASVTDMAVEADTAEQEAAAIDAISEQATPDNNDTALAPAQEIIPVDPTQLPGDESLNPDIADDLPTQEEVEALLSETAPDAPVEEAVPDELVADAEPTDAEQATDLHRRALSAFRAQDLDTAISLWDEVLTYDPTHEPAILHRAQAVEMRKKLNNLN